MTTTDRYSTFPEESDEHRRQLCRSELILEVTESIAAMLESQGVLRKDLAERLGKSQSHISQILGGSRNLTLRTLADIADALDCKPIFEFQELHKARSGDLLEGSKQQARWLFESGQNMSYRSTNATELLRWAS